MIYTSYFAKIKKFPESVVPVSISQFPPEWYSGQCVKAVAPPPELLKAYKNNEVDFAEYTKVYTTEVLEKMNVDNFLRRLNYIAGVKEGEDPVWVNRNKHVALCCFEKNDLECHRSLLSDYLVETKCSCQELTDEIIATLIQDTQLSEEYTEISDHAVEENQPEEVDNHSNNEKSYVELATGKTIFFTGRRPNNLYGYDNATRPKYQEIVDSTYSLIESLFKEGYTTFISGGAQGFDQLAFWAVNRLKKNYPEADIKNIVYVPCDNQSSKWAESGLFSQKEYDAMINHADEVVMIGHEYTRRSMIERDAAMVESSDLGIALFPSYEDWRTAEHSGTAITMKMAERKGIKLIRMWPGEEPEVEFDPDQLEPDHLLD